MNHLLLVGQHFEAGHPGGVSSVAEAGDNDGKMHHLVAGSPRAALTAVSKAPAECVWVSSRPSTSSSLKAAPQSDRAKAGRPLWDVALRNNRCPD